MSYRILESVENISSCLRTLENVVTATNFYDNILIGKHISRFSVLYKGCRYFLYVLKDDSSVCQQFKLNVGRVNSFGEPSSFVKVFLLENELKCVGRNKPFDYFDTIFVEDLDGTNIYDFLRYNVNFSYTDIYYPFSQLRHITSEFIWLLESKLLLEPLAGDCIVLYRGGGCFNITEHTSIKYQRECEKEKYHLFVSKIAMAIVASWLLFFKNDDNYKLNDALLEYIQNFEIKPILSNFYCDLVRVAEEYGTLFSVDLRGVVANICTGEEDVKNNLTSTLRSLLDIDVSLAESYWESCTLTPIYNYFKDSGYELCSAVIENRVVIKQKWSGKYGYSDNYGNIVCEPIFNQVTSFYEGIAVVENSDGFFAINKEGKSLFNEYYSGLEWFGEFNIFVAQKGDCWMVLNRFGERITYNNYSWIGDFSSKIAVVESLETSLQGYVNIYGDEILETKFTQAYAFNNNLGRVELQGVEYHVLEDGTIVLNNENDE